MNFSEASGCLFRRSLRCYWLSLGLGMTLYALTVGSLFVHQELADAVLIAVILILQIGQVTAKYRMLYWYGLADQTRRMDQLQEGLGMEPDPLAAATIRSHTGLCKSAKVAGYWFTTQPKGPRRLIEMVEESAFYTQANAGACSTLFATVGAIGLALCLLSLLITVRVGAKGATGEIAAHVIVASLGFFLASDFVMLALQYRDLKTAAGESLRSASERLEKPITLEGSLELAMTYNSALAQSPPLLPTVHFRKRDSLAAQWDEYVADQSRTMGT
jgi:hypothetical protein